MKKSELFGKTEQVKNDTKSALQTLWDNINKGQQKQIIKRKEIKELFERYGVEYER